jgi:hypothetical protein
MTQEHPITPPPELVQQWLGEFFGCTVSGELSDSERFLATRAAQWGADQELEACCEWIAAYPWLDHPELLIKQLRAARRPKPPSLKEQALDLLDKAEDPSWDINDFSIVRRALEALPDSIVVFPSQC